MIAASLRSWFNRFHRQPLSSSAVPLEDIVWSLGSLSALRNRPFDADLLVRELPAPPLTADALITASRALKFRVRSRRVNRNELTRWTMPCLVEMWDPDQTRQGPAPGYNSIHLRTQALDAEGPTPDSEGVAKQRAVRLALVAQINATHVLLFRAGSNQVSTLSHEEFDRESTGVGYQLAPAAEPLDHMPDRCNSLSTIRRLLSAPGDLTKPSGWASGAGSDDQRNQVHAKRTISGRERRQCFVIVWDGSLREGLQRIPSATGPTGVPRDTKLLAVAERARVSVWELR